MATDIIGSLFGVNPQAYQQARDKQAYAQDYQAVQLDPLQQANLALRQGGRGLGQLAGGLLGVEDPELAKASQIKQLASQFDLNSSEGLRQLSNAIKDFAPQEAMLASKRADEVDLNTANITAKLREKEVNAEETAKRLRLTELQAQYGESEGAKRFYDEINQAKAKIAKAGAPGGGPDTTVKAFEMADPEALKEYRTQARSASGQLAMISQARENLPSAVTGQGLPTIIRGLNAQLAPLGINTETVASTRNLEQALKSIISQGIKQYGANPSTVDLQFAVQAAADIKDPLQAITATLNYLETRAKNTIDKADSAEQFLLTNKNLAGFEKQWTNKVAKPTAKGKSRTLSSGVVVIEED